MYSGIGYSQQKNYINSRVTLLEVCDSILLSNLDRFVEFEKQCEYYSPELVFLIFIHPQEDYYLIDIASDNGLGIMDDEDIIYGGFIYKGHYVEVSTNKYVNVSLKKKFFKRTNQTKEVKRYKPFDGFDKMGNLILESIEDDSFSFWVYQYSNNEFFLKEMYTYCNQ